MSTKTSIKRIALVAAAALTLGGFSAVSAQANLVANGTASASSIEQVAGTGDGGVGGVAGPANSLKIVVFNGQTTAAVGNLKAFVSITGGTISAVTDTDTVVTSGGATAVIQAKAAAGGLNNSTGADTLTVLTPTAGSIVINVYDETAVGSGLYASTPSSTKTITVNATGVSGTATVANSTIYDTITVGQIPDASLLTAPSVSATTGTARVRYLATFKDANAGAASVTYTVSMTGPGSINSSNSASGARALSATANNSVVYLFGDGTSGTTVITWSVGTTVIGTKTVTFYGSTVKTIKATVNYKYVGIAATGWAAPASTDGNQNWVSVDALDSSGNAVSNSTSSLTATSSNTAALTVGSFSWDVTDNTYHLALTGVAAGTATVTIKDAATGLISATADFQVVSPVVSAITFSTDKASYLPGEKVLVQINATNAAGNPVADGTYFDLIADTQTSSIPFGSGSLFSKNTNKPSFKAGLAYRTLYAPLFNGDITLTANLGATSTLLSAALKAASAAATDYTAKFNVTSGDNSSSSLAYDAASAATDAANNAYEEAQNATQAASDALAAVKALAVQVKALIALVNKIKAKLKA